MLVLSMGGAVIGGQINGGSFSLSGIGLGIISGIILTLFFQAKKQKHGEVVPPAAIIYSRYGKCKKLNEVMVFYLVDKHLIKTSCGPFFRAADASCVNEIICVPAVPFVVGKRIADLKFNGGYE